MFKSMQWMEDRVVAVEQIARTLYHTIHSLMFSNSCIIRSDGAPESKVQDLNCYVEQKP